MSSHNHLQSSFESIFDGFIGRYISASNDANQGLLTHFDNDWRSPCLLPSRESLSSASLNDHMLQIQHSEGALVAWQPYLRMSTDEQASITLRNIEEALETDIPWALQTLFCRYFSHDLNAQAQQGSLTILQAWNEEDFERLQKNLIAHVLMKRRLKQAETMFFALTDEDDFVLSVVLKTGEVVLERVGKEPQQQIASDLPSFISTLEPLPQLVSL